MHKTLKNRSLVVPNGFVSCPLWVQQCYGSGICWSTSLSINYEKNLWGPNQSSPSKDVRWSDKASLTKKQYRGSLWTVVVLSPSQLPDREGEACLHKKTSFARFFCFCFSTDGAYSHTWPLSSRPSSMWSRSTSVSCTEAVWKSEVSLQWWNSITNQKYYWTISIQQAQCGYRNLVAMANVPFIT